MKTLKKKTYFVVMSSVFHTSRPIHVKYDLKGSTVGRITKEEDCAAGAVQKDINLHNSGDIVVGMSR
jgi:1-phosphatidylinositol-4-phosphate 5-kinase